MVVAIPETQRREKSLKVVIDRKASDNRGWTSKEEGLEWKGGVKTGLYKISISMLSSCPCKYLKLLIILQRLPYLYLSLIFCQGLSCSCL